MDMSSMTMSGTASSVAASTTPSAAGTNMTASSMSSMSMSGSDGCKISMLWNWNTIDACFISPGWHIHSQGAFAASCIGVVALTVLLEGLRRATKEFDRYLVNKHAPPPAALPAGRLARPIDEAVSTTFTAHKHVGSLDAAVVAPQASGGRFRPSALNQACRAALHTAQFGVAYFIMLLAMYYNGYFIICILIGAFLGAFLFQWEALGDGRGSTSAANQATVCCG